MIYTRQNLISQKWEVFDEKEEVQFDESGVPLVFEREAEAKHFCEHINTREILENLAEQLSKLSFLVVELCKKTTPEETTDFDPEGYTKN